MSLSLTTQTWTGINVTTACRRKNLSFPSLFFISIFNSHLFPNRTCFRAGPPCLPAQHLQGTLQTRVASSPASKEKLRLLTTQPQPTLTIRHTFFYCRGHLILDWAQLVNSWHHREHLCEIPNSSRTWQEAAVQQYLKQYLPFRCL